MKTKSSSLEGLSDKKSETAKQSENHVKQTKRWLSSKWTDWETFFAPFATKMLSALSKKGELVLVLDGSQTAGDCVPGCGACEKLLQERRPVLSAN